MTRIAHLTDLHFGAVDPVVREALEAALAAERPDLLVVSGDLTLGARLREFREAKAWLDARGVPVLAVPGNHDVSPYRLTERFFDPWHAWRREISPLTEPEWRDEIVGVVGVNTARRAQPRLDWSLGRIGKHGLARLLARLDALPAGLTRIVVAHHPLIASEGQPSGQIARGAARALEAMAARHVRLILAGHLHRAWTRAVTPAPGAPLVIQGGSAFSTRLRGEPNAYAMIETGADGGLAARFAVWTGKDFESRPITLG